jgi:hypothetical protein
LRFRGLPGLGYETPVVSGVSLPRQERLVRLIGAENQPAPFWSRAGREKRCSLPLDVDPCDLDRAILHVVVWDGGRGSTDAPFTLNGCPLQVAGSGEHDVLYRQVEVDPAILRRDANEIRLLSDTEHHGIEVLRPGPALMICTKGNG